MCGNLNIDVECGLPSPPSGARRASLRTEYSVRIVATLVQPANQPVSLLPKSTTIYFLGGGGGHSAASRGPSRPAFPIHPVNQNNRKPPTTEYKPSFDRAASPKRSICVGGANDRAAAAKESQRRYACLRFWSTPSRRRHHEPVTLFRRSELLLSFFLFSLFSFCFPFFGGGGGKWEGCFLCTLSGKQLAGFVLS